MNETLARREKRANLWDAAKKYRDAHIANDGTMTAEDAAVYDRMVDDVDRMKKEIDRLERQESIVNRVIDIWSLEDDFEIELLNKNLTNVWRTSILG